MSTIQDKPGIWSLKESDSRYEKCRNITEEIYKRINITFQIKQLETAAQSDVSEQRYAYFNFFNIFWPHNIRQDSFSVRNSKVYYFLLIPIISHVRQLQKNYT